MLGSKPCILPHLQAEQRLQATVTSFEAQDLIELAQHQFQWTDLVGHGRPRDGPQNRIGMLLLTEAHPEHSAGLVILIGSSSRRSPVSRGVTAASLAQELHEHRQTLLSSVRPPANPSESVPVVPCSPRCLESPCKCS